MHGTEAGFRLSLHGVEVLAGGRPLLQVPTLEVSGRTLLHLVGENGAGKTTLLRALTGGAAYRGQIRLGGAIPGTVGAKALTAYVPTDATLLEDLTVGENVECSARAWRKDVTEIHLLARRFGLQRWWDAWTGELSRGTRQKVALSLALGLGLPLTLLDEPFGTLDTASRSVLLEGLRQRVSEGGLVVITTHGEELSGLTRQIVRIADGTLVAE